MLKLLRSHPILHVSEIQLRCRVLLSAIPEDCSRAKEFVELHDQVEVSVVLRGQYVDSVLTRQIRRA